MMQVIASGRGPRVEIHKVERAIHGNGIDIKVYGRMLIGSQEWVYARELKLNTVESLVLTVEHGGPKTVFVPWKSIYHAGEYDNYASIDIWDVTNNHDSPPGDIHNPDNGSIWLNFIAEGE
jgi:hypothetical protein